MGGGEARAKEANTIVERAGGFIARAEGENRDAAMAPGDFLAVKNHQRCRLRGLAILARVGQTLSARAGPRSNPVRKPSNPKNWSTRPCVSTIRNC